MTKLELIKELEKLPDDAVLCTKDNETCELFQITSVDKYDSSDKIVSVYTESIFNEKEYPSSNIWVIG